MSNSNVPHLPMEAPLAEKIFSVPKCVVCLAKPTTILFKPCRHLCVCQSCDHSLQRDRILDCPLCRTRVETRWKRGEIGDASDFEPADLDVEFNLEEILQAIRQANPKKHWNWASLSRDPDIAWDIVEANSNKPWVWDRLSQK